MMQSPTPNHSRQLLSLDPVRQRPGMYIGNPDERGLETSIMEVVAHSVDDFLDGFGTRINVCLHNDGSISVEDFGRGMEVEIDPQFRRPIIELRLGTLNYDALNHKPIRCGSWWGLGISSINALSEWMRVSVRQKNHTYSIAFQEGALSEPLKINAKKSQKPGFLVQFKPDPRLFWTTTVNFSSLAYRLEQIAYLNKKLFISLHDNRSPDRSLWQIRSFYFLNGPADFVRDHCNGFSFSQLTPVCFERSDGEIFVTAAIQYEKSENRRFASFANCWPSILGGVHVSGFLSGFRTVLRKMANARSRSAKRKRNLRTENLQRGLMGVLNVNLPNPQYGGATKSFLVTPGVHEKVRRLTIEGISEFFSSHPKDADHILHHLKL